MFRSWFATVLPKLPTLWHFGCGLTLCNVFVCPELRSEELPPLTVTAGRQLDDGMDPATGFPLLDAAALVLLPVQKGTYQDLFATVAGGYGGNPSVGSFSLRGLSQDGLFYTVGTAANPLIPVLEDGAPLTVATLRYLPPVLWDLEAAEVLRGPQLFGPGPNGMGGTLRLHTAPAGFDHNGKALLEAAGGRTLRAGIAQDFVLRPDELALRLSMYHGESGGDVTNLVNADEAFGAIRRDRYQARLRWQPSNNPDTSYDLSLVHDRSHGNPFGTARAVSGYDLLDRKTALNLDPSYPARRDALVINATLALTGDLELKSTTAVQRLEVNPFIDLDETPVLRWMANGNIDERRLTQDLGVARDEGPFQWQAGGYLDAASYELGYSGIGVRPLPAGSPFRSVGREDVGVLALYARGDREFRENLHLSGGLRLQHERRDVRVAAELEPRPEARSADDTAATVLLPELGLQWRPDDQGTVGARVSRGFRGGGVSFAPSLGSTRPYEAESSWDLELHGRTEPLDTLALSASLFHSWLEDQQVTFDSPGGLKTIDSYVANAARSRRYGGEVEARWQPWQPLALTGTLGWVHSAFDELVLGGVDRSGQSFPNAPEWTTSLGAAYQHPSGFFASTLFSWADSAYTDPASPALTALETRRLLSARVGYSWQQASVYLFGSNLLDCDYALAKFDNSAKRLPVSGQIAPGRSFGLGCQFSW